MEKSFENTNHNPLELEKEDILEKDWNQLKTIAQIVGGDFGMKIIKGKEGGGSFFNPEEVSITLDPLHVRKSPELAKFVAGHEGSHRAITPNPKEIGLSSKAIKEFYSQIGFDFLQNAIEDPAVNDWMTESFPGLRDYVKKNYDDDLAIDGVVLSTPKVKEVASRLGYWPKFAQYGSEIIRDWHQKRFSENLDSSVEKALKRTIQFARESISDIPKTRDKNDIIQSGQRRFQNNTNYIWPEVKKLVEMDINAEKQRQMLKDLNEKQKETNQKTREADEARKNGNNERVEELESEIEELKKELFPFDQLSEGEKREIQEQIDKSIRKSVERLNEEIEELKKETEKKEEESQELDEENLQKQIDSLSDAIEDINSENEMPLSIDDLSKETREKLKKLFDSLPQKKKKELEQKAKDQLEELEDILGEEMEGKLNDGKPENHKERKNREVGQQRKDEEKKKQEEERRKIEEKIKEKLEETMTPYERRKVEVIDLIDGLHNRLMRILKPQEYGGEDDGYPSGQFLDINRAMQADINPIQKYKIWKRETDLGIRDYRFWHLVDLSGSMEGDKLEEMFKGLIIAGEAIGKIEVSNSPDFTIRQGISGFHNEVFQFKKINERFSKEVKDNLSGVFEMEKGGTNTYLGTKDSLEKLMKDLGESSNFLLTFSDGQAQDGDKLKDYLAKTKKEREEKKIKIGLIWLNEIEDENQLKELIKKYGYDFGLVMPATKNKKGKSFSQKLADLLEDIVKNPEKY